MIILSSFLSFIHIHFWNMQAGHILKYICTLATFHSSWAKLKAVNSTLMSLPNFNSNLLYMSTTNMYINKASITLNYMQIGHIESKTVSSSLSLSTSSSGLLTDISFSVNSTPESSLLCVSYNKEKLFEINAKENEIKGKIAKFPIDLFGSDSDRQAELMQMCSVSSIEGLELYTR